MAERAGFEPAVPCGTPDFESGTFDHSATSPNQKTIFRIYLNIWQTNICNPTTTASFDLHACPNVPDVFG